MHQADYLLFEVSSLFPVLEFRWIDGKMVMEGCGLRACRPLLHLKLPSTLLSTI